MDEPIVAAQWFKPYRGWESSFAMFVRALKRVGASSPDAKLTSMNAIAVTATRVVVYTARTGMGGIAPRKLVGEWPLDEVTAGGKRQKVTSTSQSGDSSPTHHDWKILRATLRGRGGQPEILRMDMPDAPDSQAVLRAIRGESEPG